MPVLQNRCVSLRLLTLLSTGCEPVPNHPINVEIIDLSHELTTFRPKPDPEPTQRFAADLTMPVDGSHVVAAFSDQMVIVADPDFPGVAGWARIFARCTTEM